MARPANLTEDDLLKIGKDRIAGLLAIPDESRNDVISHVKSIIRHEAYNNATYVRVYYFLLYLWSVIYNIVLVFQL